MKRSAVSLALAVLFAVSVASAPAAHAQNQDNQNIEGSAPAMLQRSKKQAAM